MKTNRSNDFVRRHIGPDKDAQQAMLDEIGAASMQQLIEETIPEDIRLDESLDLPEALTERDFLRHIRDLAEQNEVFRTYIGQGYYGTHTPSVILRNMFHNPGWYTQYTPYQAEISQGRLEALVNFQTMICDLTGFPLANASLLDEGTASAEAMSMMYGLGNKRRKKHPAKTFLVDEQVFPQTIDVLQSRAEPMDIEIKVCDWKSFEFDEDVFGVLLQYPDARGEIHDYRHVVEAAHDQNAMVCVAADILSLSLLSPPGEWGADIAVGSSQRFGIPMGAGGPHAAYFATRKKYKRYIPGRIIGVSVDTKDRPAFRMALQTREQHIKREKATSNICTAQALLAEMAGMYAVYHGPDGLKSIAESVHYKTSRLYYALKNAGYSIRNQSFFDTITIEVDGEEAAHIRERAHSSEINLFYGENDIRLSLDETVSEEDLQDLASVFECQQHFGSDHSGQMLPEELIRTTTYLDHPVFNRYHTETEMMRYLKQLENRDMSLVHSMIPLGSCTMKLNAASELLPVSWPEFAQIHPFAPREQREGYTRIIDELGNYLAELTGLDACSFQPNSGAQGEFAGLMTIRAYHRDRGEEQRNIALIPSSAHGTNPASAVMAGMKVVVVECDERGNIDLEDLKNKAEQYSEQLSALMVTYPSTHGVFEKEIREICSIVHQNGGMVYMDGANMNAQVGLTTPGKVGTDVCHLNLHKTFAIPHGGGGPGMGPICVNDTLAPYLPSHRYEETGGERPIPSIASAAYGSASILLISYAYIRLLGRAGLKETTEAAILNANYLKSKLKSAYEVLYTGEHDRSAHEFIIDLRPFKSLEINAEDLAKRLVDYGFHAPTLSWPVHNTFMIEPGESENKAELDLFVQAMLSIREEIDEIARGDADPENNVLVNAPHALPDVTADHWPYPYKREKAAYPLDHLYHNHKFWVAISRIDNAYGDRNLMCTCPPLEAYEEGLKEIREKSVQT